MPRDGSGVYTLPPGTQAVTDTTIESTKYNGFIGDIATDLNAVRPIIAGGTGAGNPTAARQNMQAERSEQQIANYDSHAYETGSFWSAAGATSAPNGTDGFTGQITRVADGAADKWTVVARSRQSGTAYIRQKVGGGAWSVWITEASDKVAKIGDTMTGDLVITKTAASDNARLWLNPTGSGQPEGVIIGQVGGSTRWVQYLGNDYKLQRYNDAGISVDIPLTINRATGLTTFAGPVTVAMASANLNLNGSDGINYITAAKAGVARWTLYLGDGTAESGGNAGSNLRLRAYNDAGGIVADPLVINRANGAVTLAGTLNGTAVSLSGSVNCTSIAVGGSDPTVNFTKVADGNVAQSYINVGANARWLHRWADTNNDYTIYRYNSGGALVDTPLRVSWATGAITTSASLQAMGYLQSSYGAFYCDAVAAGNAYVYLRNEVGTAQCVMYWERSTNRFIISNTGGERLVIENGGALKLGVGFNSRAGIVGAYTTSVHNFVWTGALQAWVDASNVGNVTLTSDYRIKKDVEDLPGMWDTVKALRPVQYTHKDFTPPIELEARAKAAADRAAAGLPPEPDPGPFIRGDNILRYGFIAHELQAALVPSAASGVKDQPNAIQALNIDVTVAALTKALQEAMARIEVLEAKLATP